MRYILSFILSIFIAKTTLASTALESFGEEPALSYKMITATVVEGELQFSSKGDFDEVLRVGFFRIKTPEDVRLDLTREFARNFIHDEKYTNFGSNGPVNGFITSEKSQSVRFCLERDYWDKKGFGTIISEDNPNYPKDIQEVANQLRDIGITVLKSILTKFKVPEELWFQATAGCVFREGSYYLNFNHYDPKHSDKPIGLGAHTDWGFLTVLDVVEKGLEAEIEGAWRPLILEDGYLTINFGEPLQKLLPGVKACNHRVILQTERIRTSTIMFIDPRVGPFRPNANKPEEVGMVWDWDDDKKELINGEVATDYFKRLSEDLYGTLNEDEK